MLFAFAEAARIGFLFTFGLGREVSIITGSLIIHSLVISASCSADVFARTAAAAAAAGALRLLLQLGHILRLLCFLTIMGCSSRSLIRVVRKVVGTIRLLMRTIGAL
jgi:hypothetical protein